MNRENGRKLAFMAAIVVIVPLTATGQMAPSSSLPDFIRVLRVDGSGIRDDFEFSNLQDLGFEYFQGHASFAWPSIEPRDDGWKWGWTDEVMAKIAQYGLKHIAFFIAPKSVGLPWDSTITRTDPRFAAEYEEFAYEVVNRYRNHPAWSGIVAVWGGSSDIWGVHPLQRPEVQVPLLNAAYDGAKRADSNTVVVSFNMATTWSTAESWEAWHDSAFALSPRFDWFGVQSHGVPTTVLDSTGYGGVVGLINVRRFLGEHGYADKPIFLNEGGFLFGGDIGGLSELTHAEQTVETYIVARTLDVNLRGWVYFINFMHTHLPEDFGILSTLEEHDPPQPRQAWYALQALIKTVRFFDYQFDAKLSGEYNSVSPPFVYRFAHREAPSAKLWIIFSPRVTKQEPVTQTVSINVAPATQAVLIDMFGVQATLNPDASGNISITSTSSPVYLKADLATAVAKAANEPFRFELLPAFPNPFNPAVTVSYTLSATATVRLTVHDLLGRVVATLAHQRQGAGYHQVQFMANALASGVYICRFESKGHVEMQKILLLK